VIRAAAKAGLLLDLRPHRRLHPNQRQLPHVEVRPRPIRGQPWGRCSKLTLLTVALTKPLRRSKLHERSSVVILLISSQARTCGWPGKPSASLGAEFRLDLASDLLRARIELRRPNRHRAPGLEPAGSQGFETLAKTIRHVADFAYRSEHSTMRRRALPLLREEPMTF